MALVPLITACSTLAHVANRAPDMRAAGVSTGTLARAEAAGPPAVEVRRRPNVIVVLADDVDGYAFPHLRTITRRVVRAGVSYPNAFSGTPLSAAARATLLSGQRTRDHRNWTTYGSSGGGGEGFTSRGGFEHTIASEVPDGYFTGWFGKVMPGYGTHGSAPVTPPGWDRWFGMLGGGYHGADAWQNGKRIRVDDWFIDAIEHRVVRAIDEEPDPLFMVVAPFNVHDEIQVEPKHASRFAQARYPRTPAFGIDRDQLRLKPKWVRGLADGVDLGLVDESFRMRLRAALPIDELVDSILDALVRTDRLDDTYLIVTSDNGFRHDEFGIGFGKNDPYDPSQRIPLAIRGPGIAAGAVNPNLVSFVDLPATLLSLTGARIPSSYDGVSLIPTFDGAATVRATHVIEGMRGAGDDNLITLADRRQAIRYHGFRTLREKYIETRNRDGSLSFEYYDLVRDPSEVENRYATLSESMRLSLATRLDSLMSTAA